MDIKSVERCEFQWGDDKRAGSLQGIYNEVVGKLDDSIKWYQSKRVWKRRQAWIFRVTALILGSVAVALPTAAEMLRTANGWLLRPGTAAILGIFTGALLWLDRLIGASSAWIRYTLAETALKELKDELGLTFTLETGSWAGQPSPTLEQAKHALVLVQGFLARANQIVRDETNQWKSEFQSALQQTEELAKVQPRKVEEAVGMVKITNPDRLAGAWEVSINGAAAEPGTSDSKSFRLTPGPVTIRVSAEIKSGVDGTKSRTYTTEVSDVLAPSAPKLISITLPQA